MSGHSIRLARLPLVARAAGFSGGEAIAKDVTAKLRQEFGDGFETAEVQHLLWAREKYVGTPSDPNAKGAVKLLSVMIDQLSGKTQNEPIASGQRVAAEVSSQDANSKLHAQQVIEALGGQPQLVVDFSAATIVKSWTEGSHVVSHSAATDFVLAKISDGTVELRGIRPGATSPVKIRGLEDADGLGHPVLAPDASWLAALVGDTLYKWQLGGGAEATGVALNRKYDYNCMAMHPGGKFLVGAAIDRIDLFDPNTGAITNFLDDRLDEQHPARVLVSPDSSRLAILTYGNHGVIRFDIASRTRLPEQESREGMGQIRAIAMSPDSKVIIGGDVKGNIWRWDQDGRLLGAPLTHPTPSVITAVAVSGDGKVFATRSADGMVCLWHSGSGSLAAGPVALPGSRRADGFDENSSLALSENGKQLVWGGDRDGAGGGVMEFRAAR